MDNPEEFDVPDYTIFACVIQNRVYRVSGRNMADAEELLRDDYAAMRDFDVIDEEISDITVEDEWKP
jgi:hypothetical protein